MTSTPPLRVAATRDLGPQFVDNPHRMVGQDGAYSIPLGDGTALWFFGDTLVGERPAGQSLWYLFGEPVGGQDLSGKGPFEQMINNTGLVLRDRTGRHGLEDFTYLLDPDGRLKQLIPAEPGEHPDKDRLWCLHGCLLGGRLYLYYIKVRMHERGGTPFPVGFDIVGSGLAVGVPGVWAFRRVAHAGSTMLWPAEAPRFASSVLVDEAAGLVYLYGVVPDAQAVQQCYLARVPAGAVERLDAHTYFDGTGWQADWRAAAPVFSGMPNEMSVSFNPYLGCYLAVHSLDLTGQIVGRTAPAPWGPWSEPVVLYRVAPPEGPPPPYPRLIYAGKEHPELAEENGRVLYATYIEFEEYYPHLVEITLA